jgi:hypothetical protein
MFMTLIRQFALERPGQQSTKELRILDINMTSGWG